jgi:hypothetical protein
MSKRFYQAGDMLGMHVFRGMVAWSSLIFLTRPSGREVCGVRYLPKRMGRTDTLTFYCNDRSIFFTRPATHTQAGSTDGLVTRKGLDV